MRACVSILCSHGKGICRLQGKVLIYGKGKQMEDVLVATLSAVLEWCAATLEWPSSRRMLLLGIPESVCKYLHCQPGITMQMTM